jgi:hypothetical protein
MTRLSTRFDYGALRPIKTAGRLAAVSRQFRHP